MVRIGTEGAYPPFNFIDDATGEIAGFDIDVANELCLRAEFTCEWVINDWDSIIPNLVSGNYDTIMAGMSITPERDAVIDFTQNYLPPNRSAYVALSEDADLAGGVIATQTGTMQAAHVAESGATVLEFPTPDDTIAAVQNGEADAVLADKSLPRTLRHRKPRSDICRRGCPAWGRGGCRGARKRSANSATPSMPPSHP